MNTIYTVDYFIKKFESIPEEMMITETQGKIDNVPLNPHCAIGWCKNDKGQYGFSCAKTSQEAKYLYLLFVEHGIHDTYNHGQNVADVNNGDHPDYQQSTPKQRILAVLYDIKAKQQPEVKERIVYVTVDEKVRELQKTELSLS